MAQPARARNTAGRRRRQAEWSSGLANEAVEPVMRDPSRPADHGMQRGDAGPAIFGRGLGPGPPPRRPAVIRATSAWRDRIPPGESRSPWKAGAWSEEPRARWTRHEHE